MRTTGELNDDDSASNATVESGVSSSIVHGTNRVSSSLSQVAPTSGLTPKKSAAAAAKERQQQQPRDRLEQMIETTVGGATGQWPKRRPSKATSRTRQPTSYQPPQPSRRRRAQPDTSRVPLGGEDLLVDFNSTTATAAAGAASVAAVEHGLTQKASGDHDDDSIEDGLVVSSVFPRKFVGGGDDGQTTVGGCGEGVRRGTGITAASSCVRPSAGQTTSVIVAPFHGPVPVSLAFGSGSDAFPMVPVTDETSSVVDGSSSTGARSKGVLFDDLTTVRGISVGQNAVSKGGNHNPHNQPSTPNREPIGSGSVVANSATVFPISTWDGSGRTGAADGSGNDNGFRIEGEVGSDSAILTGKSGDATTSSSGRGGGSRADRAEGRSCNHTPEPRRAPRSEPAATAGGPGVVYKDHHAQPPHPLKHGLTSAEATAQQQSSKSSSGRIGVGSYSISGTGVSLPWRNNSRRQAPTTTSLISTGGGGAGANRRRLRREQTRTSAFGEGGGTAGLNWSSDGVNTTATTKGVVGNVGATSTNEASLVIPNRWGERLHGGGVGGAGGASGGVVESEPRSEGACEDNRQGAVADPEGMVLVASAVVVGGSGAGGDGGTVACSGTTKGWRAAGDSLANLKARMGVKNQQHPPVAAAAAAGVVGGKRNAAEGVAKDRGPPHHIPHQTF